MDVKPILIIQNGYMDTHLDKYLDAPLTIIKSYETNLKEIILTDYSFVIILGGHQSVTQLDNYPYLTEVIQLIDRCLRCRKKMIGICLGCQLIAYALGCSIKSFNQLKAGYDVSIMDHLAVFRCHADYIVANNQLEVLEYFDNVPYLYLHQDFVIGIQCHPDITPECVIRYSHHYPSICYARLHSSLIDTMNETIIRKLRLKIGAMNAS